MKQFRIHAVFKEEGVSIGTIEPNMRRGYTHVTAEGAGIQKIMSKRKEEIKLPMRLEDSNNRVNTKYLNELLFIFKRNSAIMLEI